MKKNIVPLILISSIFIVLLINAIIMSLNKHPKLAEGYTINQFDTSIEVFSNNTFSVDEHINVNWEKTGYQGLIRIVPNISQYTSKDGKSYKSNLNIPTLRSSEQYSVCEKISNNQLKLTIGKPGESVQQGYHTYQIQYDGNFGEDIHKGFDELIFHAYGDNWGTRINNPSLSITLPTEVDNPNIKFFADKNRKNDITGNFYYSIDGRTIRVTAKEDYSLNGSLTIDIILPDGYFSNAQNNYHNISAIICIFSLIVCITIIILCVVFIRHNPKFNSNDSQAYPPDSLDASQIGFIFKTNDNSKKLSVALIMSLVSKGYIKIFDIGNNQYHIFNLTAENSQSFRNEKNIPIPNNIVFGNTSNLKPLSKNEQLIFNKLFEKNDVNAIYTDSEFYTVFATISNELKSNLGSKLNVGKYKAFQITSWIFTIISLMLMVLGYYGINDIQPQYQFLYIIGWISCIISIIPSLYMGMQDLYGDKIRQKVNDFKQFIENSQPSQLEELMKNDIIYYYNILPYAYVFGINKNWTDKFKSMTIPSQVHAQMDTVNYLDYYILDNISDNLHYPTKEKEK